MLCWCGVPILFRADSSTLFVDVDVASILSPEFLGGVFDFVLFFLVRSYITFNVRMMMMMIMVAMSA